MKLTRRKAQIATFSGIAIVLFALICMLHNDTDPIANVAPKQFLVGKWSFVDRFGRTHFWNLTDAGLLYRHTSDDPTAVRKYEWWVKDGVLTARQRIELHDRLYHWAVLGVQGRKLNDQRTEFRLSEADAGSWQMSWVGGDGRRNSTILRREISSALDDERSNLNR